MSVGYQVRQILRTGDYSCVPARCNDIRLQAVDWDRWWMDFVEAQSHPLLLRSRSRRVRRLRTATQDVHDAAAPYMTPQYPQTSNTISTDFSTMRLTYFGHSAFQLETKNTTILVDPFITGNKHTEDVITADELDPDVILLTHAHGDHWGDTPGIATRSDAVVVANFEISNYITEKHDHDNVQPMNTGGSWNFDWGRVTWTFARHSSSFPDGTYGGHPNGIIIEAEGKTIYDLGDTDPFTEMEWLGQDFDVDVALMPIGDCFTMGASGAVRAAKMIGPKVSIPIHYNTFPPIEVDVGEWEEMMSKVGFDTSVLKPGETLEI